MPGLRQRSVSSLFDFVFIHNVAPSLRLGIVIREMSRESRLAIPRYRCRRVSLAGFFVAADNPLFHQLNLATSLATVVTLKERLSVSKTDGNYTKGCATISLFPGISGRRNAGNGSGGSGIS